MKQPVALKAWNRLKASGPGRWLFSRFVCFKAPYFSSISPLFLRLETGIAVVSIKKRHKVKNHIGTIHAIAMANLCEIAAGTVMEASLPLTMRWIPKGMTIQYLAKAESTVTVTAKMEAVAHGDPRDIIVDCSVKDVNGKEVVHADICMYVTPRPTAA